VVLAGEPVAEVDHAFTHVKVTYHAVRCAPVSGEERPLAYDAWAWVAPGELGRHALPTAQKKIGALAIQPSLFRP
jgi:A/G-specific adenine glycosylase